MFKPESKESDIYAMPPLTQNEKEEQIKATENDSVKLKRKDCVEYELDFESGIVYRDSPEYKNSRWVIFPEDKLKTSWDLFIMVLVLYTVIVYSYRFAFLDFESIDWTITEYVIDFCFFIDSILTFFTYYYNSHSQLVVDHKSIAIHYLKFWFWIDLAGYFPYEIFEDNQAGTHVTFSDSNKPLLRTLRILKILRIFKWWNNTSKIQELKEFLHTFKIKLTRLKLLAIGFILFCHIMACFWCMLPRSYLGYNNWERNYKIEDNLDWEQYVSSIYFIITTVFTIGFGDIIPKNNLEISIAICVMGAGVFVYSYTISSMTSLIAANNHEKSRIEEYSNILQGISTQYKLAKPFHKKLQDALIYNLKEKRTDISTLINSLPPKMASKLKYKMNEKLIENNSFFNGKPTNFVQRLLEYLMPYKVESEEFIYKEGSPCDEMYFVLTGEVAFVYDTNVIYESVLPGGYFGDAELFTCEERETSVKALKKTKMLTLDKGALLSVLKEFIDIKVKMIVDSMIKRKQLKKTSIMCSSLDSSQDIHISPIEFTPEKGTSSDNVSVKFIIDCSSSLDSKN